MSISLHVFTRLSVISAFCFTLLLALQTLPADAQWVCPRPDPDPGCPQLTSPYPMLPASLSVPTRWGALNEAPSMADTTLVCEGANQEFFALWRRHERASECVWIDRGNLTLRSGAIFDMGDFPRIDDPELSFGLPGEVAIVEDCGPPFNDSDEIMDLWLDFDQQWSDLGTTTGILALHTKRLIDEDGDSCARGLVAEIGDPAMPWLAVSDPQDLCDQSGGDCQYNERSLAHEFGHLCGLVHVGTAGRLMVTGGDNTATELTVAELDACRQFIEDNPGAFDFDVAPGADLVAAADFAVPAQLAAARVPQQVTQPAHDAAFDPREDDSRSAGLDMRKIMVQRSGDGGLDLHIVTDGLMTEGETAEFTFAIDIDNNAETGADLGDVLGGDSTIAGVEWVGTVQIERAPRRCTSLQPELRVATVVDRRMDRSITRGEALFANAPRFREVKHPGISATFRTACMVICDFDARSDLHEHVEVPTVQRLVMRLPGELVVSTGPIRVQIFSRNPETGQIDLLPDRPAEMTFGRPVFPSMRLNPREAMVGDVVQIDLTGLKPGSELHTLLGATEITSAAATVGQNGRATVLMPVPAGTSVGPHLVTVGADVFTGDDILNVVAHRPDRPPLNPDRSIFELLVSYEDLLRRQAIQLDKFSDLIRTYERSQR